MTKLPPDVILSAAKNLGRQAGASPASEILRCAQDDM